MKSLQLRNIQLFITVILCLTELSGYAKSGKYYFGGNPYVEPNSTHDRIISIKANHKFKQTLIEEQEKSKNKRREIAREIKILEREEKRTEEKTLLERKIEELLEEKENYQNQIKEIKKNIIELPNQILPNSTKTKKKETLAFLVSQKEQLTKEMEKIEIEIKKQKLLLNSFENYEERLEELKKEDTYLDNEIKRINSIIKGNKGDIIARGIAGKANGAITDVNIGNNVLEGIKIGCAVRVANSSGDAIGRIVDKYSYRLFGGFVVAVEKIWTSIYRFLFHHSRKPFTIEEVKAWKQLISTNLKEIEMIVKNAEKYSSRSREEILRELENESLDLEKETLNLWKDFIEELAYTCEKLAEEIENRKGFYKKQKVGFGIHSCSDTLINKLLKVKAWLINVQSAKDFATLSEMKLIITAMKRSFDFYFENLENQITPFDTVRNNKKGSSLSRSSRNNWKDPDNDFPSYLN